MNPISSALWIYLLTIVFALGIAVVIHGMGLLVKRLGIDRADEELDLTVPSSNALKEEEMIAIAVVAAHARKEHKE